jgi:putative ABC transport system permease protein
MMRALDQKVLRDLSRIKGQAFAIALVIASGVALFLGMVTTYRSLRLSEHHYYDQRRFAHVWAVMSRAPRSITREVAAVAGVVAVEGRIKEHAILDVGGLEEPASTEIVSIPKSSEHSVNDLYLRKGRHIEPGRAGEVLISEAFAEANHVALGAPITVVLGGKRVELRVVGVALSPEYVMPVPPTGLAPDDRRYAVLWMAHDELEALVDLRGAINEIAVRLAPGADERAVIAAMDRLVEPYGGRGAYGRSSQPSHTMLEEHIRPLRSLAVLLPAIFLLVAAFLVNMVLGRIVGTQREQIGLLKAFGYSSGRVAVHYLELTMLIVLPGIGLGLLLGGWFGRAFADFYGRFFRFPELVFRIEPGVAALASIVAVFFASLGALGTVRRVIALPPVVAMTPEIPAVRRSPLDFARMARFFTTSSRMVVRNATRRPLRTALSVLGMSMAVTVTMIGNAVGDSAERARDVRYQAQEREDMSVSLVHPRAIGTIKDFLALPGIRRAEPYRVTPARLLARGQLRDVLLFGLPEGGILRNVVDTNYRPIPIPRTGAVLTAAVAKQFGLRRDDLLALEIRENRRRVVTTRLVDVVDDPLGASVYMNLEAMGRLLGEPETYSGANLIVDPASRHELYTLLKRTPSAVAVDFRAGALLSFRAMSDTVMDFARTIDIVFAVIIAFGVVYNSAKIALAERAHELATLRVLGFTRGEVSRILLGEIAVLAAPAVPLGFATGHWLSGLVLAGASGDRMHLPHVMGFSTYGFAFGVFSIATFASALVVRRGLDHLDLIGALKARE